MQFPNGREKQTLKEQRADWPTAAQPRVNVLTENFYQHYSTKESVLKACTREPPTEDLDAVNTILPFLMFEEGHDLEMINSLRRKW